VDISQEEKGRKKEEGDGHESFSFRFPCCHEGLVALEARKKTRLSNSEKLVHVRFYSSPYFFSSFEIKKSKGGEKNQKLIRSRAIFIIGL